MITIVGAGEEIPSAVARAAAELQDGDPLAEVLVVTPPGSTADTIRRAVPLLGRGVAGLRFATPIDLARRLVEAAEGPIDPVTPQLLAASITAVLADRCPPELAAVAGHPSTVDAIVTCAERLRFIPFDDATVAAPILRSLGAASPGRDALLRVAAAARADLRGNGYVDEIEVLRRAIERLDAPAGPGGPRLVLVLSDALAPGQVEFVRRYLGWCGERVRVIVLGAWDGDAELRRQVAAIAGAAGEWPGASTRCPLTITSAPDHDEEVRHVVRSIATASIDEGIPLDRIAVLTPPGTAYRRVVTDELDRAGIAWSGHSPRRLAESVTGAALRLLIDARAEPDRRRVLRLLAAVPHRASANEPHRDPARWRQLARRIGLVTAADWDTARETLERDHHADTLRRRASGREPNEHGHQRDVEQLDRLLALVATVRGGLGRISTATRWADAADALTELLTALIGTEQWRVGSWAELPDWQFKATDQALTAIVALADLDRARVDVPYSPLALERLLLDLLDRPIGRQAATAGGVRLHPVTDAVCLDADIVFLVGALDGVLPPGASADLFAPADRDDVAARFVEHAAWQRDRTERAWASLMGGSTPVQVSWPRADMRRGGETFASRLLAARTDAATRVIDDHADGVLNGRALTIGDVATRDLRAWTRSPVLHRRVRSLVSRARPFAGEYDGSLGDATPDPFAKVHSITAVERLAGCGIAYLLEQVLGVRDETDPAALDTISPLDKGNLVHGILEDLATDWLSRDPGSRPAWLGHDHVPDLRGRVEELLAAREDELRAHGLLGHAVRWRIERQLIIASVLAALDVERGEGGHPLAAEYQFGFDGNPTHDVTTAVGTLRFRGKIDRIDRVGDEVVVTDFKTTRKTIPTMSADDPTEGGQKLQLALYRDVAVGAFGGTGGAPRYRYITARQVTDRALPDVGTEHTAAHLETLAGRLASGDFRPGVPSLKWGCTHCSPDGLGLDHVVARATLLGELAAAAAEEDDEEAAAAEEEAEEVPS